MYNHIFIPKWNIKKGQFELYSGHLSPIVRAEIRPCLVPHGTLIKSLMSKGDK